MGDVTEYLSEDQLATAIRLTVFPNNPSNPDGPHSTLSSLSLHTAGEIAHALFQTAIARREEAAKWVTGALYTRGDIGGTPQIYLREEHGWWAYRTKDHYRDGTLDTTSWVRLVPEVPPYPAEDGPLKAESFEALAAQANANHETALTVPDQGPGHDVRGTAESHERGWYHNCPGCVAQRDRLQATEAFPNGILATEADH